MFTNFISTLNEIFNSHPFSKTLLISLLLVIFFFILKKILSRQVDRKKIPRQEKILLKRKISQVINYILITCIFLSWFAQLQVFFVSILAVAAAIVIALKELIMCLTGGILLNVSHIFKVGQRIEVDGARGFVIEKNLLTTKILEIGPERNSQQTTGEVISIPNSLLLSKSLRNESFFRGYCIKSFIFKMEDEEHIEEFEKQILDLAQKKCAKYIDEAKAQISRFCEKEALIVPAVDPKTKLLVEEGKDLSVLVKLPVRNNEIAEVEQELNRFYLRWRIEQKRRQEQTLADTQSNS